MYLFCVHVEVIKTLCCTCHGGNCMKDVLISLLLCFLCVNQLTHVRNGMGLSWVRIAADIVWQQTAVYASPQNTFNSDYIIRYYLPIDYTADYSTNIYLDDYLISQQSNGFRCSLIKRENVLGNQKLLFFVCKYTE